MQIPNHESSRVNRNKYKIFEMRVSCVNGNQLIPYSVSSFEKYFPVSDICTWISSSGQWLALNLVQHLSSSSQWGRIAFTCNRPTFERIWNLKHIIWSISNFTVIQSSCNFWFCKSPFWGFLGYFHMRYTGLERQTTHLNLSHRAVLDHSIS